MTAHSASRNTKQNRKDQSTNGHKPEMVAFLEQLAGILEF